MSSPSTLSSSFHRVAATGLHLNFYANRCCNYLDVATPRMLEMIVAPVDYIATSTTHSLFIVNHMVRGALCLACRHRCRHAAHAFNDVKDE